MQWSCRTGSVVGSMCKTFACCHFACGLAGSRHSTQRVLTQHVSQPLVVGEGVHHGHPRRGPQRHVLCRRQEGDLKVDRSMKEADWQFEQLRRVPSACQVRRARASRNSTRQAEQLQQGSSPCQVGFHQIAQLLESNWQGGQMLRSCQHVTQHLCT